MNIFAYRLRFVPVRELEFLIGLTLRRQKTQVHGADVVLLAKISAVLGGV